MATVSLLWGRVINSTEADGDNPTTGPTYPGALPKNA